MWRAVLAASLVGGGIVLGGWVGWVLLVGGSLYGAAGLGILTEGKPRGARAEGPLSRRQRARLTKRRTTMAKDNKLDFEEPCDSGACFT